MGQIKGQIKGIVVGNSGGKLSEADQETLKVLVQQLKDVAEEARDQGVSLPRWSAIRDRSVNELVQKLKISKTTANKIVLRLVKEKFIQREIIGKTWRLSCNLEHKYNFSNKICYYLNMIFQSRIINEVYKKINNPQAIILFGSYRKGDDLDEVEV